MKWFKKLIDAPSGDKVQLVSIRTYTVRWTSRHGTFSSDTRPEVQAFTNIEDAEYFAQALRDAFKLIRHTAGNVVEVESQEH